MTTLYAASAVATATYYTRYLAEAPGEVPGVWTGGQAAALGLSGEVSGEALVLLLQGRDPTSESPLGRPLEDRFRSDGRVVRAVAGFDATFSAPKSLSVLWALTGDARLLEAHDVAVAAALAHVERFGSTTRVRVNRGRQFIDTEGLTIAAFRQTTSRADDPQIHTHAVIAERQADLVSWDAQEEDLASERTEGVPSFGTVEAANESAVDEVPSELIEQKSANEPEPEFRMTTDAAEGVTDEDLADLPHGDDSAFIDDVPAEET